MMEEEVIKNGERRAEFSVPGVGVIKLVDVIM